MRTAGTQPYFLNQLLFFLVIFCLPVFSSAKPISVTIYCDDANLPYSYASKEREPRGIYTEVLSRVFKQMKGYDVKIVPQPWTRAISALEKNEVFAVYPPYHRPVERPFIKDYSVPILDETIVVYARTGEVGKDKRAWPQDWYGKKVGIFTGTVDIAGEEFTEAVRTGNIQMVEAKSNEENLRHLITRKVDAYVNDRNAIIYTLQVLKSKGEWPANAPGVEEVAVVSKEMGYVAFSQDDKKYPFKKDFIKKFNAEVLKLQRGNEIERITEDYLSRMNAVEGRRAPNRIKKPVF